MVSDFFFHFLLLSLFFRLSFQGAYLEAWTMGAYFLFSLWVYFIETPLKKRFQKILPVLRIPILYFALAPIMGLLAMSQQDALLQKLDEWLIGGNLSLRLQAFVSPALTECMYIYYMLFFVYVLLSLIRAFIADEAVQQAFYVGFFTIYWIGFLGYSLVLAVGPYLFMSDHFVSLQEGVFMAKPIYELIAKSSNYVDVFPSLHCAVSAFCLFFDYKHCPSRFWWYLPFCILVWFSTIYLAYHYFIDVVVGFALAGFALKVSHVKWKRASC